QQLLYRVLLAYGETRLFAIRLERPANLVRGGMPRSTRARSLFDIGKIREHRIGRGRYAPARQRFIDRKLDWDEHGRDVRIDLVLSQRTLTNALELGGLEVHTAGRAALLSHVDPHALDRRRIGVSGLVLASERHRRVIVRSRLIQRFSLSRRAPLRTRERLVRRAEQRLALGSRAELEDALEQFDRGEDLLAIISLGAASNAQMPEL